MNQAGLSLAALLAPIHPQPRLPPEGQAGSESPFPSGGKG